MLTSMMMEIWGWLMVVMVATTNAIIDLPFTQKTDRTVQSQFCVNVTSDVYHWRGHLVFDQPISQLHYFNDFVAGRLNNNKEFVIAGPPMMMSLQAGSQYCAHFTAVYTGLKPSSMTFYIEGMNGPTPTPDYHRNTTLWQLNSFDSTNYLDHWRALQTGHWDEGSGSVVDDPDGGVDKVLRVLYEKGHTINTPPHRGLGFYAKPTSPRQSMTLSYDVYFDADFNFVKGGMLPGLYGGAMNCSGVYTDRCFDLRIMWREKGHGEIYATLPLNQTSRFHSSTSFDTSNSRSFNLGRGSFKFAKGQWQSVTLHISLNTPGKQDGFVKLWHNGHRVFEMAGIIFREQDDIFIDGVHFSTYFGGSTEYWAPTDDSYAYFRNFILSADNVERPHVASHPPGIIG